MILRKRNLLAVLVSVSILFFSARPSSADKPALSQLNSANESSPHTLLHGQVKKLSEQALSEYAPFGFSCVREGSTELPAKVTALTLSSVAYKQGMRIGDKILLISLEPNKVEFTIKRAAKSIKIVFNGPLVTNLKYNNDNTLEAEAKPALQQESAKSANVFLQGGVQEAHIAALAKYSSFGFLCSREGVEELPASVSSVTVNTLAYEQGLKTGDRICRIEISQNAVQLKILRESKPYQVYLSTEHPFSAQEIANTSLKGVIQKNFGDC